MDDCNDNSNEPAASEFVLEERDDARVLNSAIIDQVDEVVRVLSQQIVAVQAYSHYVVTMRERMQCARLIAELSDTFQKFLMM